MGSHLSMTDRVTPQEAAEINAYRWKVCDSDTHILTAVKGLAAEASRCDGIATKSLCIKAFADLRGIEAEPTASSQIAGYACLSRCRELEGLILLQAFSPFLFRMGQVEGADRLVRELRKGIDEDQCNSEWWDVASKKAKRAKREKISAL